MTTMITPFVRFCWSRFPFGHIVVSEIFQRKVHEAKNGLKSFFMIANAIIIVSVLKLKRMKNKITIRNFISYIKHVQNK